MTRWKKTELAIASKLGGKRVPVTGRSRGDAPDIQHDRLALEIKDRAQLPKWLHDAMSQAVACRRDGQYPVVVLHEAGMKHADDYVVMRLSEFVELTQCQG